MRAYVQHIVVGVSSAAVYFFFFIVALRIIINTICHLYYFFVVVIVIVYFFFLIIIFMLIELIVDDAREGKEEQREPRHRVGKVPGVRCERKGQLKNGGSGRWRQRKSKKGSWRRWLGFVSFHSRLFFLFVFAAECVSE